ncbi:MAG: flagellar export chaperone FliS [Acetivibrionales bacterium]|jgi:flagellar protein FliS|nr:flagellar export chaperone FliS [Clostridiaceae bacterium]
MIAYNAYNQYKENSIFTASPEELTLMLYNGLVKFIMRGIDSIEKKNIPEANTNIIKAQNIVSEFMNTLDMNYEISGSLNSIYDYMLRRLIDANVAKDAEILDEVLGFAKVLRDTWEQAMKISKKQGKKLSPV